MKTNMEENIEDSLKNIKEAYNNILKALDKNNYGYDRYSNDYINKLHQSAIKLLEIEQLIK